ncbi:hypothetical protein QBC43DRAFT_360071 [Cladorrhinum sp. PSN259]|nr:hypothetical protein QBC43DRAFT_360071 [Cladorrhinum sp. PSN259]
MTRKSKNKQRGRQPAGTPATDAAMPDIASGTPAVVTTAAANSCFPLGQVAFLLLVRAFQSDENSGEMADDIEKTVLDVFARSMITNTVADHTRRLNSLETDLVSKTAAWAVHRSALTSRIDKGVAKIDKATVKVDKLESLVEALSITDDKAALSSGVHDMNTRFSLVENNVENNHREVKEVKEHLNHEVTQLNRLGTTIEQHDDAMKAYEGEMKAIRDELKMLRVELKEELKAVSDQLNAFMLLRQAPAIPHTGDWAPQNSHAQQCMGLAESSLRVGEQRQAPDIPRMRDWTPHGPHVLQPMGLTETSMRVGEDESGRHISSRRRESIERIGEDQFGRPVFVGRPASPERFHVVRRENIDNIYYGDSHPHKRPRQG